MQTLSDKKNPFVGILPEAPTKESSLQSQSARVTADSALWFPPLPVTTMPGLDAEPQSRGTTGISSGIECALKALSGSRLHGEDVALLVKDRQARIDFFGALQARHDEGKVCAALHDLIAADGPESYWFLRKNAFEQLRVHSSVPLTASLGALVATKDCALRARILEVVMKDLSFPLSPEVRQEISQLGVVGGQLCNSLLVESPTRGERPRWVSMFPRFVRAWILASAAVGIDHGVDAARLNRFSRETGGPLNDWQIRVAVEPLDPLSWGGVQGAIRRLVKH
jgi:hypothetical protein